MRWLVQLAAAAVVCLVLAGCQDGRIPPASLCLEDYSPCEFYNQVIQPCVEDCDLNWWQSQDPCCCGCDP